MKPLGSASSLGLSRGDRRGLWLHVLLWPRPRPAKLGSCRATFLSIMTVTGGEPRSADAGVRAPVAAWTIKFMGTHVGCYNACEFPNRL